MINMLKKLFRSDPRKLINKKYEQAMQFQRNGKLREYAELMKEIETLEDELVSEKKEE